MPQQWEEISIKAQEKLKSSLPAEWCIPEDKLPPKGQKDVTIVPKECGLLSDLELGITDSYATSIVKKIAAGEWKAEDVTRAFCKRAVIAHQLVCPHIHLRITPHADLCLDELPDRSNV